ARPSPKAIRNDGSGYCSLASQRTVTDRSGFDGCGFGCTRFCQEGKFSDRRSFQSEKRKVFGDRPKAASRKTEREGAANEKHTRFAGTEGWTQPGESPCRMTDLCDRGDRYAVRRGSDFCVVCLAGGCRAVK